MAWGDVDNVWQNSVDGDTWRVWVERVGLTTSKGMLCVQDTVVGDIVHSERVNLAYGARFGPDVSDVAYWTDRVIDVIDNPEQRQKVE